MQKIQKRHKINTRKLKKRMIDYSDRTGKFSPLNQLEYNFLKMLYMFLTKQYQSPDSKHRLYEAYIKLVDVTYFPNRSTPNPELIDIIYKQFQIILDNEYKGPYTFILLNSELHYQKMFRVLKLIKNWQQNPDYYGFATEKEFYDLLFFIRRIFSKDKYNIDIEKAVGKWPKKLRQRFNRISKLG